MQLLTGFVRTPAMPRVCSGSMNIANQVVRKVLIELNNQFAHISTVSKRIAFGGFPWSTCPREIIHKLTSYSDLLQFEYIFPYNDYAKIRHANIENGIT